MKIDFLATETHFVDHLVPTFNAIDSSIRGRFYVPQILDSHVYARGIDSECTFWESRNAVLADLRKSNDLLVVAASGNIKFANWSGRPAVLCQHGSGQSYGYKRNASYAGYPGHKGIALFLHPGPHPVSRDQSVYPNTPVVAIGCPKLDDWHTEKRKLPKNKKPIVVISFHWPAKIGVPEALGLGDFYESGLKSLVGRDEFEIMGHAHPRAWKYIRPYYEKYGVPMVRDFEQVINTADVYCVDNSSTLFEFASTGRPVVVLNGPPYRKDINFGLRFWSASHVGVNCEHPGELLDCIISAIGDKGDLPAKRADALSRVYAFQDGRSAERAAAEIVRVAAKIKTKKSKRRVVKMAQEKTVWMRAKVTFADPVDGYVRKGSVFLTTENRARMYENPTHNIAERDNDAPQASGKTNPAGPETTKVEGPDTEKTETLDGSGYDLAGSEALESAMKERVSFGPPESGWVQIYIDGLPVQKARPSQKGDVARRLLENYV